LSRYFGVRLRVQTGFGLMIGFTGLFDTARNYILQCITTHTPTYWCPQSRLLQPLLGNFRRRTFPFLWVPKISPYLSYQLLTATAHNEWTSVVLQLTNSVTHRPSNSTRFSITVLLITPRCGPHRKHRSCSVFMWQFWHRTPEDGHLWPKHVVKWLRNINRFCVAVYGLLPSNGPHLAVCFEVVA
jgi:hypothetical protein